MNRREFLKTTGVAGLLALLGIKVAPKEEPVDPDAAQRERDARVELEPIEPWRLERTRSLVEMASAGELSDFGHQQYAVPLGPRQSSPPGTFAVDGLGQVMRSDDFFDADTPSWKRVC